MIEDKKRNIGLDILKIIVAFLVICIHAPFENEFGKDLKAISRCAVPIFFMITGFFYTSKMNNVKSNKQILKLLKLCIISNIFYIIFQIVMFSIDGKEYSSLFKGICNKQTIKNLILYNESPVYFHLWYLNALLYVLIIVKFVNKYNIVKYMYYISPILLILDLIYGKYSLLLLHREIPYIQIRNYLFVGIPYFYIGNFISQYIYSRLKEKNNKVYMLFIILFMITTIIERRALTSLNLNATREHYISSTFLAIALFLYFLLYNSKRKCTKFEKLVGKIGREYSTLIYILHPVVIEILSRLSINSNLYQKGYPIVIFCITLIVCFGYKKIYSCLIKYKNNKKAIANEISN